MKTVPELKEFVPALRAVQELINQVGGQGAVIEGVAVTILGKPRLTADVDVVLLISNEELPRTIEQARKQGLDTRAEDALGFARRSRTLLLRHRETDLRVDVAMGAMPFEVELVERSQLVRMGDLKLRVPTVEDLVIQKAVAHRRRDMDDIEGLLEANPDLDRERIENWVKQFAVVLESPEIWTDLEKLMNA